MPRAFLITHRRYNILTDEDMRGSSPEHKVSLAESLNNATAELDVDDELYNLTKLAEVSLAAAAGQFQHLRAVSPSAPATYAHKLFNREQRSSLEPSENENSSSATVSAPAHGCPDCGKRYSTSSNLARHRQTHRSLADKKARRCPHCDKVYVSMPAFSMHVRTHAQGCKCPFCGKCFSRPWLLQGHIRTHTGEKPFKCPLCAKAFADKSNLRAHIQTHSNTKPHICGRCGKAFALKSYLYKHEESSCMRAIVATASSNENENRAATVTATATPTPVIVRATEHRCTVISPNPKHHHHHNHQQQQPVDFSKNNYSVVARVPITV